MTKAELIAELEALSKKWGDEWAYSDSGAIYSQNSADDCADQLDALIARAKQTTDTTP